MTRYPPGGQPEGYQGPYDSQQQPPQYGQSQPAYGAYPPNDSQGYNQHQGYQQQHQGYGEDRGQAHSYYGGSNEQQQYQQYPPQHTEPQYHQGGQAPYPPPETYVEHQYGQPQYGAPPQQYGQSQYGKPSPGPAQQQYTGGYNPPAQQHYMQQPSGEVDVFKSHFDQPNVAPGHYPPPAGQYPPGAEGDRGLMGALAGGAAGAFGGHKMGHGVLGGLGGAVAGSMLEDAYKKKDKKPKKDKKEKKHNSHSRRGSSSSSSSSSSDDSRHHGGVVAAGNFRASSRDVRIDGHCLLVAECSDSNGHHHQSTLDLNDCFTNSDGRLCWAKGGNFAASARHIRLSDDGNAVEAELGDGRGGWQHNKVWLNERISNNDGRLEMLH